MLAGYAFRQEAILLLGIAKSGKIRPDQSGMQRTQELAATSPRDFFDDDLFIPEIRVTQPAMTLVRPDHQHPLITGLFVS